VTFEELIEDQFPNFHLDPNCRIPIGLDRLRRVWDEAQNRDPQPDDVRADTGPSGVLNPAEMKFVPKRWGWESWIANNELYCGKILFIKAGKWLSYHYHKIKDEVLYVQSGRMNVTSGKLKDEEYYPSGQNHLSDALWINKADLGVVVCEELGPNSAFHVTPWMPHQMEALEDTVVIEFSTKHRDEDSYRVSTDNLRTGEPDPDV
jgi:mannose-6-phosphate isomerase-like protein (cupin superfamily)